MSRPSHPVSIPACLTFGFSLLLTCVSAVALLSIVDAKILSAIPRFDPSAELKVRRGWTLKIEWAEDVGWYSEGSRKISLEGPIAVTRNGVYFEVKQSDLDIETIKENAGWPPKLSERRMFGQTGIVSYRLTVSNAERGVSTTETDVAVGFDPKRRFFYLFACGKGFDHLPRVSAGPAGCDWYIADAEGFVKLAKAMNKEGM